MLWVFAPTLRVCCATNPASIEADTVRSALLCCFELASGAPAHHLNDVGSALRCRLTSPYVSNDRPNSVVRVARFRLGREMGSKNSSGLQGSEEAGNCVQRRGPLAAAHWGMANSFDWARVSRPGWTCSRTSGARSCKCLSPTALTCQGLWLSRHSCLQSSFQPATGFKLGDMLLR